MHSHRYQKYSVMDAISDAMNSKNAPVTRSMIISADANLIIYRARF